MTLTSFFNKNFLKENIKKSKPILLLFGILFPILFTTVVVNTVGSNNIIDLTRMNILMWIFIFLPILLTYVLFGYLNKRKSVDFINSLPITRKQIFFTNTIAGISLIEILILLNIIVLFITTLFLKDIILPGGVVLDYFILWSVTYTFIFIVTNLCISISGNMITTIMLTLIFIFILPFTYQYTTHKNYTKYIVKGNEEIKNILKSNKKIEDKTNKGYYYTDINVSNNIITNTVYDNTINFIYTGFSNYKPYNSKSIIMTFILSIIYLIIGYFVYLNKKMEVVEVSFKSYKVHTIFKSLILLPLVILLYNIIKDGFISLIILLVIIGLYYVIDLVTRIGIKSFKKSIIYFIIFIIVGFSYTYISNINKDQVFKFNLNDIENVSIESSNLNFNNIEDKKLINKIYLDSFTSSSNYIGNYKITYKLGNKTITQTQIFNSNFIKEIKKYIKENNLEKHLVKLNYEDIETIRIFDRAFKKEELSKLKEYINKINEEELIPINDNALDIGIYKYDRTKHDILELNINNVEFYNYLLNIYNKESIKNINNIKSEDINHLNIENYSNDTFDSIYDVDSNLYDDILKIIDKNKDKEFKINEDYLEISIHYYKDNKYNSSRVFINDYLDIIEKLKNNKDKENEY